MRTNKLSMENSVERECSQVIGRKITVTELVEMFITEALNGPNI